MNSISISRFVRRQTYSSEFSYFNGSDAELLSLVGSNFDKAKPGYRDGVVLVPVDPKGFFSGVVKLQEGDKLVGEFKARKPGELAVKEIRAFGKKLPAVSVDVVLYRHDVLAENNERSSDADWEIISINGNPVGGEMPISSGALMRNFFCEAGGTDTKMTAEEFVDALRESRDFWRDKALVHVGDAMNNYRVSNKKDSCTCESDDVEPHGCPFAEDIGDDYETTCTCCSYCTTQCAMDI